MSTLEHLFMQIFDRKQWIVDQMKQQVDSYEQSVVCNLAAAGRRPPDWLLSNGSGSDVPGCSTLTELNGKQIIPDILFPSSRFTTPSSCNTFSIPSFNPLQNITNKQIHKDRIAEEDEIPKPHSENRNEKQQSYNPNPAIQIPNSVTQRSRSRQKAITKRLSAEQKAKSGNHTSFKPSVGNKESGVDFVDRMVCTENDAVEPKRLSFGAGGLGNLGNENDSAVEKKDGAMEISSPVLERTNCEVNKSGVRDVDDVFYECSSVSNGGRTGDDRTRGVELTVERSGSQHIDDEFNETSSGIEKRATELKSLVRDEAVERPSFDITEQELTEALNHTEIDADEVGSHDLCGLMEIQNRTENNVDMIGNPDSFEPMEIQNHTEIDADGLENPDSHELTEIQNFTENNAAELHKTAIDESAEILNCTEKADESAEILNCTEKDADVLDNPGLNEPTEISDCTENDAAELKKTAIDEPAVIPNCMENDEDVLDNPAFNEPTGISDCTENDAAGLGNSGIQEPTGISDCTENDAAGLGNSAFNEPTGISDCTENDLYEVEKTGFDEPTEIRHRTEINAPKAEKLSLRKSVEILNRAEIDATVLEKPVVEEPPTETQNKLKTCERVANETLICTENDAVELETVVRTRDSVGEIETKAVFYACDSYSPAGCGTGEDGEKRGEMIEQPVEDIKGDNNNNNAVLELEMETEIDPKSVSEFNYKAETILLQSGEVMKRVESGGKYILQELINNDNNNNVNNNSGYLECGIKRQVDIQVHENDVNSSSPKRRKIEKFFLDSALAAASSSGQMKEKEQRFTEPSYFSAENTQSDEAQHQTERKDQNNPQENLAVFNSASFSTNPSSQKDKSPLTDSNNFSLSPPKTYNYNLTNSEYPHETELEAFKQEDTVMPELEGFSMEISPISEDQTANLPEILSLAQERASLIEQLFSTSKNASSSGPHLSPKYNLSSNPYRSFDFMKSTDPFFEYNGSETGLSFSGKSEKPPPFTPPAGQRKLAGLVISSGNISSGKLVSSTELTCFRIDEDSGIEESEVPNDQNAPEEENIVKDNSQEENDQNGLEENVVEMDFSVEADANDSQNDRNTLGENVLEEDSSQEAELVSQQENDRNTLEETPEEEDSSQDAEVASQLENDRNALRDLTAVHNIDSKAGAPVVSKSLVLEGQGQLRNYPNMKPKQSAASSIRVLNELKKAVKPVRSGLSLRAGSSLKGPEINADNNNVRGSFRASSNIVSHVPSFVQLVKQKQQPPVNKKREIRIPALEAAEAKKKLDEKKRNEKEMQKLEREREMKRKQEEAKRKQEEEQRKKKEAELANRKRQREERERKEKDKEREKRRKVAELAFEKERSLLRVLDEKEVGPSSSVISNYKIEIPKKLKKEKEYEMSPYRYSDDEGSDVDSEEEEKRRKNKFIPPWARKESYREYYMSKLCFDPATIFRSKPAFDYNGLQRRSKKSGV